VRSPVRALLVGAALVALAACTSDDDGGASLDGSDEVSSDVTTSDGQDASSETEDRDDEVASGAEDDTDDGDGVSSSVTTTDGDDIRSEAEVRVGEILSDYDGRETDEGTQLTVPSHVLFDFDEDQLRPDARDALDEVVEVLEYYDDAPVDIVGHTDSQGAADYNQGLSERRARSVAAYLVDTGIPDGRLTVSGRGEEEPVASNDTEDGRQANRRVEILIRGVAPPADD
jgi:outer membrane protein OmpA-like peptidoglycan-associated protein